MTQMNHNLVSITLRCFFGGVFTIWLTLFLPVFALAARDNTPNQPANGSLDTTFTGGVTDGESNSYVSRPLADGKILVGGTFQLVNGVEKAFLARLNSDGSLDTTFNMGGSGPNGLVYEINILPSGQILIGGFFTSYNGTAKSGIVRLNANGTLDSSFNSAGTGTTGGVQTINLQTDGKIVISSNFTAYNGTARQAVARLNADGSLDTTFTSPFAAGAFVEEIDVLSDGKFIVGGVFNLSGRNNVMRLNSNGTVDTTFNMGGTGTDDGVYALNVQPDGKILIGGAFGTYNGVVRIGVARLNTDGTLDTTFFAAHIVAGTGVESIDIQPDGKILLAGGAYDGANLSPAGRVNSDGTDDPTFNDVFSDSVGYHITRQADGKILLTGLFNSINATDRRNIVRLNADATVDSSFNAVLSDFGRVFDIALQPDNKVIAVGNFRLANGLARKRVARFNADGTLDISFDSGPISTFLDPANYLNFINTVALQADGKILIGGVFGGYNSVFRRGILRLNSNGTLDTTFSAGLDDIDVYPFVNFQHILPLPDGKIMVGGTVIITFPSFVTQIIARLNANGTLDSTFLNGNGNGSVQRIARQADGKFIVGGSFTNIAGQNRNRITRLNADSTVDSTFNPAGAAANSTVFNLALQTDGKVLIGGAFTTYNGTGRNRIARLNTDGTLDTGFNPGSGANANVLSFALQNDSRILIGGFFSTYNGTAINRLARLNTDGSLDSSFTSGFNSDPRQLVRRMLLQPDGKLLVSGVFFTYSGITRNNLARVNTTVPVVAPNTPYDFDGDGRADIAVFRPSNGAWYLQQSTAGFAAVLFGQSGDLIVPADYDSDNKTDIAVFRPSNGVWYLLRSTAGFAAAAFGQSGDIPMPGDFVGNNNADIAVFRPSNGTWYILDLATSGFSAVPFGQSGDIPVVADYDNDGKDDIAVFRPSNGAWYLLQSTAGFAAVVFGQSGDKPAPADYVGNDRADIAVYRPSNGVWYRLDLQTSGFSAIPFGVSTDQPQPADFDGDGFADVAVFRDSNGVHYLQQTTAGFAAAHFGTTGDRAIPNAYIP